MKTLIICIVSTLLLVGCNKETQVNSKLKGTWKVSERYTIWVNNSNGTPQTKESFNIGTIVFDKKGKGVLTFPNITYIVYDTAVVGGGTVISQHPVTQDLIYNVSYLNDENDQLIFENDQSIFYYNLTWGWDKKSFTAFNRGLNYGGNNFSNNYKETIFTFIKEK